MMRRMLIVDDEETIRWALRELFMRDGWEVHCAEDGDEAARSIAQTAYDYMITDLKMPGRSGVEIVCEARRRSPRIGVTVLTGYASLETAIEALRLGAWDYVIKPCEAPSLKRRIEEFFARADAPAAPPASRGPLDAQDLAGSLAGAGTEVMPAAPLDGDLEADGAFERLRGVFVDLGFGSQRAAELLQSCVEAAALLSRGNGGGWGRAVVFKGHLVISVSSRCDPGQVPPEALRKVNERFKVHARMVEGDNVCSIVLSEAI